MTVRSIMIFSIFCGITTHVKYRFLWFHGDLGIRAPQTAAVEAEFQQAASSFWMVARVHPKSMCTLTTYNWLF